MKIAKTISSLPDLNSPVCLAIGTFDGVHLGHQALINKMNKLGTSLVFTFSNHPTEVLKKGDPVPSLMTAKMKQDALADAGVMNLVIQPFTEDIAQMPYYLFLEEIYAAVPFSHIFFGEDDAIGKNREGTPEKIRELGKKMAFEAHYLPKLKTEDTIISSSNVRKALANGNIKLAEELLGRPYQNQVHPKDPFFDKGLLKPGKFLAHFTNHTSSLFSIDEEGNILFEALPPEYVSEEIIKITVKKA